MIDSIEVLFYCAGDFRRGMGISSMKVGLNAHVRDVSSRAALLEQVEQCDYGVIVLDLTGEADDIVESVTTKLTKVGRQSKLCIVGKEKPQYSDHEYFTGDDAYRDLVKSLAKHFDISAKDLADLKVEHYFEFPVTLFIPGLNLTVDLYGKKDSDYVRLLPMNSTLHPEVLSILGELDDRKVYIEGHNRARFMNSLHSDFERLVTSADTDEKKGRLVSGVQNYIIDAFRDAPMDAAALKVSQTCIDLTTDKVGSITELAELSEFLFNDQSTYRFQVTSLCTYLASVVLKKMEFSNNSHLKTLGFCAFFHDMFLETVEAMSIKSDDELMRMMGSDEEILKVKKHAYLASAYFQKLSGVPYGIDQVLLHHHGSSNGTGFTVKSEKLTKLAVIFSFAEHWAKSLLILKSKNVESYYLDSYLDACNHFSGLKVYKQVIDLTRADVFNASKNSKAS